MHAKLRSVWTLQVTGKNAMTTPQKTPIFSSTRRADSPDFVSSDMAALALHMHNCASTRSRFFGLHSKLESAHSMVCARMVTAAVIAVVLLGVVGIV